MNNIGSGALSGKMMLVRIIENNRIDAYFMSCYRLSKGLLCPRRVRKWIKVRPRRVRTPPQGLDRGKNTPKFF